MLNFRMGRLVADVYFLEAVPRPAMIQAIRVHAAHPEAPGPIRTTHNHDGLTFHLETDAARTTTAIRLL
ncbi:MAG: hypothetical protein P4L85_14175 [Paludisphaera borealis]|uniref:hypothetical protein n=1 Tax=Paludisphaera borealis TaxID=1387353 RepID=UPI002842E30A|nr:hypothetical protein [Paludisphaera borealis]MDR3620493.1 hypothetical protein [Paludisphaera borealis]